MFTDVLLETLASEFCESLPPPLLVRMLLLLLVPLLLALPLPLLLPLPPPPPLLLPLLLPLRPLLVLNPTPAPTPTCDAGITSLGSGLEQPAWELLAWQGCVTLLFATQRCCANKLTA